MPLNNQISQGIRPKTMILNEDRELVLMNKEAKQKHVPVLFQEVVDHLKLKSNDCVVDFTLGIGGHSQLILEKTSPHGRLIGLDRDSESLKIANVPFSTRIARFSIF